MLLERTSTCDSLDFSHLSGLSPPPPSTKRALFPDEAVVHLQHVFFRQHLFDDHFSSKTSNVTYQVSPGSPSATPASSGSSTKIARQRGMDEEQKNKIASMQRPSDMDYGDTWLEYSPTF